MANSYRGNLSFKNKEGQVLFEKPFHTKKERKQITKDFKSLCLWSEISVNIIIRNYPKLKRNKFIESNAVKKVYI